MMPPPCDPCSKAFVPFTSRFSDISDFDAKSSTIVADLRWTMIRMDHQLSCRELSLYKQFTHVGFTEVGEFEASDSSIDDSSVGDSTVGD